MILILSAFDQSAFSVWFKGSDSIWAYPTVLTLHTFGMMVLVGAVTVVDLRLLGFGRAIPLGSIRKLFGVTWSAFILNAVTGTILFISDASKRATQPLFLVKLLIIAIGVVTMVIIKRNVFDGAEEPVTVHGRARLLAIASLLIWSAAITAGRLLAYVA